MKRGRIWRIVHDGVRPGAAPKLGSAAAAALVETLSHPNGWWRDTAQQLLVQRRDQAVAPQLRALAGQAADWRTRLHALWTLDGLDAIEPAQVERALVDKSPDVRASAIRLSERWLGDPAQAIGGAVVKLMDDVSWTVRRQLAASIGAPPPAARLERATALPERYGDDQILVDAALRRAARPGTGGARPHTRGVAAQRPDAVAMLAATIARAPTRQRGAADPSDRSSAPTWQRAAVLRDSSLVSCRRRRTRRRSRPAGGPARVVVVSQSEPTGLTQFTAGGPEMVRLARSVAAGSTGPASPPSLL